MEFVILEFMNAHHIHAFWKLRALADTVLEVMNFGGYGLGVFDGSPLVHNGLIGATIVASGVYLRHRPQRSSTKQTSFKNFSIKTNANLRLTWPENY